MKLRNQSCQLILGHYSLSAYMYPFLKVPKETHQYKDGTTFQQVLNLYRFDKKLRMLLLNEIEKVEIAIRRAIMNIPVQMTGDIYWLTNSVHFANQRTFQETKNTIDREYTKSTEEFIKHFKNSYCDPYPPSWILGELLTMGNVNMVYRNLKADKIRKRISHYFGLQPIVLESWITSLTLLPFVICHDYSSQSPPQRSMLGWPKVNGYYHYRPFSTTRAHHLVRSPRSVHIARNTCNSEIIV